MWSACQIGEGRESRPGVSVLYFTLNFFLFLCIPSACVFLELRFINSVMLLTCLAFVLLGILFVLIQCECLRAPKVMFVSFWILL